MESVTDKETVQVTTPKAKRVPHADDIPYNIEARKPRRLSKYIKILKNKDLKRERHILRLSDKCRRLKKAIKNTKALLSTLHNEKYISVGARNVLEVYNNLL